jgi:hypothetical protein
MNDSGRNDDRAAAEDLRRQLQEKSSNAPSQSKEEVLRWMDERRELFTGMMSEILGNQEDGRKLVDDVNPGDFASIRRP